jgi:hypothetical protein
MCFYAAVSIEATDALVHLKHKIAYEIAFDRFQNENPWRRAEKDRMAQQVRQCHVEAAHDDDRQSRALGEKV